MKDIKDYKTTFEEVWAAFDESRVQLDETKKIIAEMGKRVDATTTNVDKFYAGLIETRKEIRGLGKSFGMYAETYFFESLKKSKKFGGITFDDVEDDVKNTILMPDKIRIDGQFDIVMTNGDSIAIIEVKSKVQKSDVKYLIEKKLGNFRKLYPHYADYKFYLGVAGFSYDTYAEEEALNHGVGILKITGDDIEIQDNHLIVY